MLQKISHKVCAHKLHCRGEAVLEVPLPTSTILTTARRNDVSVRANKQQINKSMRATNKSRATSEFTSSCASFLIKCSFLRKRTPRRAVVKGPNPNYGV